ncbi:hypothetical protein SmB9_17290 [Sphingosinicella microcystinivorans]|uniref:Uncharacterized protein n=1 Tax=Sphingosinicella microcystinivorans TaxID=335406 RepID=A0AAD1D572_SPHMI|nr:hypothetical protein SmB9_17290 [Sphingosinicella microcystinivorans]
MKQSLIASDRPRLPVTAAIGGLFWGRYRPATSEPPQMALTDTAIRNAKPKEKPYKVTDALGLYLLVNPHGGKLRRISVWNDRNQ